MTIDPASLTSSITERVRRLPARDTPHLRALRREVSREIRDADARAVLDLAKALIDSGAWEMRFIAYELVANHPMVMRALDVAELEALGRGMNDWPAVDTFSCYLAGLAWRERRVDEAEVHRWARSPDRWWRRTALASTIALNCRARGGTGDLARTLAVCRMLAADRDDMVVKALSWALRELAKRDPDAVRAFLAEHEGKLAPRVVREVGNKLETGLKNPRKRPAR